MKQRRIAIVTHSLELGGGAATMVGYLNRVLNDHPHYHADVISLAQASGDPTSTRLASPMSWMRGPLITQRKWRDISYQHVGCEFAEFEPARYRARPVLTELLNQYDLIQVAAGTPPWAGPCFAAKPPVLLWTATTLMADRISRLQQLKFPQRQLLTWIAQRAEADERRALEQAVSVFGLSPYAVDALRQAVPGRQVTLAVCGVDTKLYRPLNVPPKDYIVAVARFSDARKNVGLLLAAYRLLLDWHPGAPDLQLVGEPPSPPMVARLEELGLKDRVHIRGLVGPADLVTLYAESQFTVLSSDEEGLGLVLVEGMATGVPAISTRSGGPELVIVDGENGFLTPLGQAEPLARAMERFVVDPSLRASMGRAARLHAERMFSLESTSATFFNAYEHILGPVSPYASNVY